MLYFLSIFWKSPSKNHYLAHFEVILMLLVLTFPTRDKLPQNEKASRTL